MKHFLKEYSFLWIPSVKLRLSWMGSAYSRSQSAMEDSQGWSEFALEQAGALASAMDSVGLDSPSGSDSASEDATEDMPSSAVANVHRRTHVMETIGHLLAEGTGDDPFWLDKFFDIVESVTDNYNANNFDRPLTLVSGCSGMLAEGWVMKAGAAGPNQAD